MKRTKMEKGITLIALIITIVVLLILAVVAIRAVTGDNGILTKAKTAKTRAIETQIEEEIRLAYNTVQIYAYTKDLDIGKQAEELEKELKKEDSTATVTVDGTNLNVTYKGYKKNISENGEIVDVNSSGDTEQRISDMYEEFASDEEGATEGKIHIGDYITYNPNPTNMETVQMTEKNGYKYVSTNEQTGLTYAKENNYMWLELENVTEQAFTVQSNLKWRVLGIDGENLMIIPENTIVPDVPVLWKDNAFSGYALYQAYAYENCITEINNISKIYANGIGANKEKTRGLTIDDVNRIAGVTANGTTLIPDGIDEAGVYGTSYNMTAGTENGWTPSAWINATETERQDSTKSTGFSGTATLYNYGYNENLKVAKSLVRAQLLFLNSDSSLKNYWLASRAEAVSTFTSSDGTTETVGVFGPGYVGNASVYSGTMLFTSDGSYVGDAKAHISGIYPVVYLNEDIKLTSESITDGVTTWNIEND